MKYQRNENRNIKALAILVSVMMILGVFSVFPAMASGFVSADAAPRAEEPVGDSSAYTALPDYIVYDHNYINDNLSTDKALNVTNPCWSHVATDHHAEKGFVRLKIDMDGSEATTNDPYIALELEKNDAGNGKYSLSDYNYITIVARYPRASAISARFELFFETDTSVNRWWSVADGPTNYRSTAYAAIDNWQVITFDFTAASGGLKSVRLDFLANGAFGEGNYVDIVAVVLNKDGQAAYDSSYEIMESLYNPLQILKDFAEEDVVHFRHGMNATNTVSIKDGNVIYKSNYVEANAQAGKDPYMDPYAGFKYDEYIDAQNAGLEENDPNRLQKLTPKDFRYVVLKTRTNPEIGGGLQLFVYVNGNGANGDYSPHGTGSASTNYGWRSVYVDMNANSRNSFKDIWLAEGTVFNGFRVDWAGTGGPGYFCELDEIIFFKTAEDAINFSKGLNNIPAPSDYDEDAVPDEGNTYVPDPVGDTYSLYSASDLLGMNNTVVNGSFSVTDFNGATAAALISDGQGAPSVTFKNINMNAASFETIAFAVKAVGDESDKYDLTFNFKSVSMAKSVQANKVVAQDISADDWQIVAFDLTDVSAWDGTIDEITIECVSQSGNNDQSMGFYIYSAALCFYPENVAEYAEYVAKSINTPKQLLSNFNGGDLGYFNRNASATSVTVSNGNLMFTATGESTDPYVRFLYKKFMKESAKYKALTTEDFETLVIKYRAGNTKSNKSTIDLFILDENYNAIRSNPNVEGDNSAYASKTVKYNADGEWHTIIIDMTNGGKNEPVWQGVFNGVRIDWCASTEAGSDSFFEISDIIFFENEAAAKTYNSLISGVVIVKAEADDPSGSESETLPSFPGDGDEETSETLPEFSDGEDSNTESETLPTFPGDDEDTTETLPQLPEDSSEEISGDIIESTDEEDSSNIEDTTDEDTNEEESSNEETDSSDTQDTSDVENTTDTEESTSKEESTEEESSSDEESETDDESETETPPVINIPIDPGTTDGGDASTTDGGSETPFVIACVSLGGLSTASVGTVIFIKIRMKVLGLIIK